MVELIFDGKHIFEPGAYATIKSGIPSKPQSASSGNVLLIDTGSGATFGSGAGIDGEFAANKKAIYSFEDSLTAKRFLRGGLLWDLVSYLFSPAKDAQGIPKLFYIKAATTTAGTISYTFTGGSSAEVTAITCVGDTSDSLDGKYFLISSHTVNYYVWYNTSGGSATDPLLAGKTAIQVAITTGATAAQVATATAAAIDALAAFVVPVPGAAVITITNAVVGSAPDATAGNAGVSVNITNQGTPEGGTLTIKTKAEGTGANGVELSSVLTKGYAAKIIAGIADTSKFIIQFYEGTFKGLDESGNPFDGIAEADCAPILLCQSTEFEVMSEVIDWMTNDYYFNLYFTLSGSTIVGGGVLSSADISANPGNKLAAGATESYASSTLLDTVLENIGDIDHSFFFCDKYGDDAQGTENTKIESYIVNDSEFEKFAIVAGGYDELKFEQTNGSIPTAQYFNSPYMHVVHAGIQIPKSGGGFKDMNQLYHAAMVCGRLGGSEPQTPITWKPLKVAGQIHDLSPKQRKAALKAGVLHLKFIDDEIGIVVNQGINSLQNNASVILPNGTSPEISIMRIGAQLNKELVLNARKRFVGGNLATASAADVKTFTETYLNSKKASPTVDNLIIRWENVTVKQNGTAWEINYSFVPNGPINQLFFTGYILDSNITA